MDRRDFLKKTAIAAGGVIAATTGLSAMVNAKSNNSTKSKMKIVLLTGSPRRHGNSAYLADQFMKGATEAGHEVFRFDCAFQKVDACMACNRCRMDGPCIINDDFDLVRQPLIDADMVAFATPMYYFGVSAQLKSVIDRFYAINDKIKGNPKKSVFMMTYANTSSKDAEAMLLHYRTLIDYLGWKNMGTVVANGVWTAGEIKNTQFPNEAYLLGKGL